MVGGLQRKGKKTILYYSRLCRPGAMRRKPKNTSFSDISHPVVTPTTSHLWLWWDPLVIAIAHPHIATLSFFFFFLLLGLFSPPRRPSQLTQAAVARALPHPQVLGGAVEGGTGGRAPDGAAGWGKADVRRDAGAVGNHWVMLKARGQAEKQLPSTDVNLPVLIQQQFAFASHSHLHFYPTHGHFPVSKE